MNFEFYNPSAPKRFWKAVMDLWYVTICVKGNKMYICVYKLSEKVYEVLITLVIFREEKWLVGVKCVREFITQSVPFCNLKHLSCEHVSHIQKIKKIKKILNHPLYAYYKNVVYLEHILLTSLVGDVSHPLSVDPFDQTSLVTVNSGFFLLSSWTYFPLFLKILFAVCFLNEASVSLTQLWLLRLCLNFISKIHVVGQICLLICPFFFFLLYWNLMKVGIKYVALKNLLDSFS